MKITYYGHSCFLLETLSTSLLFDPFIDQNPLSPIKSDSLCPNYILVSHAHSDHLGDAVKIAKRNESTIIASYELAVSCAKQGTKIEPMGIGGAINFPWGLVKLTIAHHSAGGEEANFFQYLGNPNGFIVEIENKIIYFAGDTGLFLDMKLIGELNDIDVAFLPIGDRFTMGAKDAAIAAKYLNAKLAIPMHYNTFDLIKADPNVFVNHCREHNIKASVISPGDSLSL